MSPNRIRILFVLALMAFSIPAAAQTGSIAGKVTVDGKSAVAGSVKAASGMRSYGAQIDQNGNYRITGLPDGTYSVTARSPGYSPVTTENVSVGAGATATTNFSLVVAPTQLNSVTTVASRAPEKVLDAPATVSVVTSQEIAERPGVNITDHVVALPGIDVARGGIARSNVVARGFNNIFSGALMTLTDNRFAFVPSLRVNIPYLSPTTNEDIERIEVVLGPAAALYGPNTPSGVMAVTTKSPFTSQGYSVTVDGGNQSFVRGSLRGAWAPTPKFGFKVTGEGMSAKEWDFLASDTAGEQKPRDRDVKRFGGEARADFRPTPSSEIIANYGLSKALSAVEPTGLGPAQVKDWIYQTYQLRARVNQLFGQVFLNTSDAGGTFLLGAVKPTTNCPNVADAACIIDKSKQFAAQIQDGLNIGTRQRFLAGVDYIKTLPRTEHTINGRNEDDDDIQEVGGYLHSVTDITDMFQVTAAARVDKHSRLEDPVFSPRLALTFKPDENQNFRITYNRAFSTPSTNNLFLDLEANQIASGGVKLYGVRAIGVPSTGLTFNRTAACASGVGGGLCMRVPLAFTPGATSVQVLPAQAALLYKAAVAAAGPGLVAGLTPQVGAATAQALVGFLGTLQPTPAEVGTKLRVLQSNRTFVDIDPANLKDVDRLKPEIHNTYEAGYKGILANRLQVSLDVWKENRKNFVGPLTIETPNVFLDAQSLAVFIGSKLPALGLSQAQIGALAPVIAGGMGGVSASATTGVPLGVVNFSQPNSTGSDVIVTYRNFGNLDLWGSDLGAELALDRGFSVLGTYSFVNKDFFSKSEIGGISDVSLNAPANKHTLTVKYRDDNNGWGGEVRERHVDGFKAVGFIAGTVHTYTLMDAGISYRPASLNGVLLAINGTNILNKVHQEFAQGNLIGRLIITRVQVAF